MPANITIQHRRGTAASWTSTNPVLAAGEIGWESDTGHCKFGDGTSTWTALPYYAPQADIPSWLPVNLQHRWGQTNSSYNISQAVMAQARAGLGKAGAGLGLMHILAIGDSETDGYMGSTAATPNDQLHAWPVILKNILLANGYSDAGTGHVKFGGTMPVADTRWTTTGTWTRTGQAYGFSTAVGATATLAGAGGGTNVDIVSSNQSANWTYIVKNSAGTTIASGSLTPSGASSLKIISLTGLTDAKTLVITTVTGTNYIFSANIYKTTGVMVSNLAYYGSKASDWASTSTYFNFGVLAAATVPSPDLIVGGLGVNDVAASVANATIYANIVTTLARWTNASKLWMTQWQAASFSDANWQTYVSGLYTSIADALNIGLMDTYQRSAGYAALNAKGLMQDATGTHPNQAVHYDAGQQHARILLS